MNPDKKKKVVAATTDFLVRYGAGREYIEKIAKIKSWNVIAWILIMLGTLSWVIFLMWKP